MRRLSDSLVTLKWEVVKPEVVSRGAEVERKLSENLKRQAQIRAELDDVRSGFDFFQFFQKNYLKKGLKIRKKLLNHSGK